MTKVLVVHAYSAFNRGDGLLVELSVELVRRSFGHNTQILVFATDADSFSGDYDVVQHKCAKGTLKERIGGAWEFVRAIWLKGPILGPIANSDFGKPDLIVGVGGGYLRADGGIRSLKAFVAHGLQARWVLATGIPAYYLPQSVGPLDDLFGVFIKRWVGQLRRVAVRDDRSMALMSESVGVQRRPDLAIFSISETLTFEKNPGSDGSRTGPPRLIARSLKRSAKKSKAYELKLAALRRSVPDLMLAVQSTGRGNNDPIFYQKMNWKEEAPDLRNLISKARPSAVISVRLHGALEAIRAGIPTIHLSYERKGFGAYEDLGIPEYVHNASTFSVTLVSQQLAQLRADPTEYWNAIHSEMNGIREIYVELMNDLKEVAKKSGA